MIELGQTTFLLTFRKITYLQFSGVYSLNKLAGGDIHH